MSSASKQHANDLPSTGHDIVGKKKSRAKFPCMLCKGSHLTHLCPRMEEASKLLQDMTVSQPQLPVAYRNFSLNPPVVDGMITPDLSSVNPIDHVVNLVMSLIERVDKVVDPIPYSVNPTLPLESVNKVVDLIPSSVDPTLLLESETQAVNPFPSVDPILPLDNATQVAI
jgi:cell division protein YceG involved in septum cleavage